MDCRNFENIEKIIKCKGGSPHDANEKKLNRFARFGTVASVAKFGTVARAPHAFLDRPVPSSASDAALEPPLVAGMEAWQAEALLGEALPDGRMSAGVYITPEPLPGPPWPAGSSTSINADEPDVDPAVPAFPDNDDSDVDGSELMVLEKKLKK